MFPSFLLFVVLREGNQVADPLVNHGLSLVSISRIYDLIPDFLSIPVLGDAS